MAQLLPHDVVPALRSNLAFSPAPQGLGTELLSVKNVANGDEFKLRGFEYSMARMLDGRRTASEVVEAAEQIGLPVTMTDLDGFVKKLSDRHLVSDVPVVPDREDVRPFEGREAWDERTRRLFRIALREGRAGNLNRALISLDCLLAQRPGTPEAVHLRERIEHRQRAGDPGAPFLSVFAQAERDWLEEQQQEPPKAPPAVEPRRPGLVIAGVCLAAGALAFLSTVVPFPHQVTRPAMLLPIASARVTAPRTGKIDSVPVSVGQWVDRGTVLFSYDVSAEVHQLEAAIGRLDALNRDLYRNLPATPTVKDARARYVRAEAALANAQNRLEEERIRNGDQLIDAEESLNTSLLEIRDARMSLAQLVPEWQRAQLTAQQAEVQDLEMELAESAVTAPLGGVISVLAVQPGGDVIKGLEAVQLDDGHQLRAIALVEPRDRGSIEAGQPVVIQARGRATTSTVTSVSGRTVEVRVDNTAGAFQTGPAEVQIRGKPVPLIR